MVTFARYVDMTEIIDNPVGVFNDCNIESFFQGSCKEHILPEEGDQHGDHVVNQESDPLCEPGGGDPCAQHC